MITCYEFYGLTYRGHVVGRFTVRNFNKAIVSSRFIRVFRDSWGFRIVIRRAVGILDDVPIRIRIRALLPGHPIARYIPCIMTKGNRPLLIRRTLIPDCRSSPNSNNRRWTDSHRISRSCPSRTTDDDRTVSLCHSVFSTE